MSLPFAPTLVALAFAALLFGGCRCSPAEPQPVTLRIVNGSNGPIYVDASKGRLGLTVQREVGGTLFGFDDLACECRSCINACGACTCPDAGPETVRRIGAGEMAERTWDGVVQTSGVSSCTASCLDQVNAPINETFTLELCFAPQAPTGVLFDDGGIGRGQVPMVTTTCTTTTFAPQDRLVEIGPTQGAACTTDAQCPGVKEHCFSGSCTSGCPANDFPTVGAEWILTVARPDNMGFFEQQSRGSGGTRFVGTGTLASAVYQSNSLLMGFSRVDSVTGETLTGRVQVKLPVGTGAPLTAGRMVTATLVEDGADVPGRAFVLRDATTREVLFVADTGLGGVVLTAEELQPFSVVVGSRLVGCTPDACGRFLFSGLVASQSGVSVEAKPGQQTELTVAGNRYAFLNVTSGTYEDARCEVTTQRPFALWKVTTP